MVTLNEIPLFAVQRVAPAPRAISGSNFESRKTKTQNKRTNMIKEAREKMPDSGYTSLFCTVGAREEVGGYITPHGKKTIKVSINHPNWDEIMDAAFSRDAPLEEVVGLIGTSFELI